MFLTLVTGFALSPFQAVFNKTPSLTPGGSGSNPNSDASNAGSTSDDSASAGAGTNVAAGALISGEMLASSDTPGFIASPARTDNVPVSVGTMVGASDNVRAILNSLSSAQVMAPGSPLAFNPSVAANF